MLTFNKVHVFSNLPDAEISDDAPQPSAAELAHDKKRLAMLASVQQAGGFKPEECRHQ
ncbi:hypothetical protein [Photobacterium alginatilyticum]|uniref:hypothetical protein n=1 Tax=Photobacterium alginatilyticum TaxID=1775171 RepID=UPI00136B30C6|nr:hypothetical protein [Photobacterium alginatilyticum]